MRLRHIVQTFAAGSALALAMPASAHDGLHAPAPGAAPAGPDTRPEWRGDAPQAGAPYAGAAQSSSGYVSSGPVIDSREAWLADCRRRVSDNGIGGAVIGGVAGGLFGNRLAGRGNRTVGTIAGAAVGAVAGAAIDKAEDRGRTRDQCETYLDDYYARANYARANPGYAYGYGYPGGYGHQGGYPAYAYIPVQNGCCQPAPVQPDCVETVEYEYVDAPARRVIRRAPDKRVRVVPDKRIRTQ